MTGSDRQRRLRLLAKVIPVVMTVLFGLLALEIYARWLYSHPTMHFGLEMWKYARDLKLRAENAELSHRHRPNAHAFLMGVDVRINALGMRDREITKAKPPGTYRILVLGDSTTLGWGVPSDQLYPKILEQRLNANPPSQQWTNYEVLNTGIGNYNTSQEVASFKERWLELNPDMVWIAWYINDAEPTPKPSNNWFAYHSYGYNWVASNFDSALRNVGANKDYRAYYNGLYEANQPGWQRSQAAFAELSQLCRTRHLPLFILLIPELHTLSGNYEFKPIHDMIRQVGATNQTEVVDLIDAFPASGDPPTFWVSPEDAHPNGKANELMAAKIEAALRKESWVK
jgi:lysophospholipase L1-like esterase